MLFGYSSFGPLPYWPHRNLKVHPRVTHYDKLKVHSRTLAFLHWQTTQEQGNSGVCVNFKINSTRTSTSRSSPNVELMGWNHYINTREGMSSNLLKHTKSMDNVQSSNNFHQEWTHWYLGIFSLENELKWSTWLIGFNDILDHIVLGQHVHIRW